MIKLYIHTCMTDIAKRYVALGFDVLCQTDVPTLGGRSIFVREDRELENSMAKNGESTQNQTWLDWKSIDELFFFRIFHINPYKYEEMIVGISLEIIRNYRVFNWENQLNEWKKIHCHVWLLEVHGWLVLQPVLYVYCPLENTNNGCRINMEN